MGDREQRIRDIAHRLWIEEGEPEGRADEHWRRAEELVDLEDKEGTATEENPLRTGEFAGGSEPVEPLESVETQGDMPTLTDQGEEQTYPKGRGNTRKAAGAVTPSSPSTARKRSAKNKVTQ